MTAERVAEIREAASLMRIRADRLIELAPAPWNVIDGYVGKIGNTSIVYAAHIEGADSHAQVVLAYGFEEDRQPKADHVAAYPDVARAAADWLEYEAGKAALGWNGQSDHAHTLALTYLRRTP